MVKSSVKSLSNRAVVIVKNRKGFEQAVAGLLIDIVDSMEEIGFSTKPLQTLVEGIKETDSKGMGQRILKALYNATGVKCFVKTAKGGWGIVWKDSARKWYVKENYQDILCNWNQKPEKDEEDKPQKSGEELLKAYIDKLVKGDKISIEKVKAIIANM